MGDAKRKRPRAAELERELERRTRELAEMARAKAEVEAELEETRRQVLHADRLATLGTLAGGFGHELGNVATMFIGCQEHIERLVADRQLPESFGRAFESGCRHLIEHTQRLLDLARPGPEMEETLDLRAMVVETLALMHSAGKTRCIAVERVLPGVPVLVSIDRTRLEQILVNLIGNAVDAVAVRPGHQRRIRVRVRRERDRALCSISDNGCGIRSDRLGAVFDPFYTTKSSGKGTGLGLSVVRRILRSYGGDVEVESVEGEGTTFTVVLPAVDAEWCAELEEGEREELRPTATGAWRRAH